MENAISLPTIDQTDNETGCCPRFYPDDWNNKFIQITDQKFVRVYTKSFFYIPLNMGSVMKKAMQSIAMAHTEDKNRYLMLSIDHSKWKCEHNILVAKEVPDMEMVSLSGNYYTQVFDGAYKDLPKWIEQTKESAKNAGHIVSEIYAFYTTCPKCAKYYGHNYVVLFSKIK